MRVAILNITSGGMSGGYRIYLDNMIPRMASHKDTLAMLVGLPRTVNISCQNLSIPRVDWVSFEPVNRLFNNRIRGLEERMRQFRPDVVFIPTSRFWQSDGIPTVTMLRNMEPLICPYEGNPFVEKAKNWFRAQQSRTAATDSTRVIAVSGFVKEFLIEKWRIPPERIGLVYEGARALYDSNTCAKPALIPEGWKGKFLFTAGSVRPARGLEDIIYSVRLLARKDGLEGLVIADHTEDRMLKYHRKLKALVESIRSDIPILWVGGLSSKEMAWCYKNCAIFIMTSRVESFGIIAVEAMSRGCICIAADNPCLPEIFGDAAVFYAPGDYRMLADKIRSILAWSKKEKGEMTGHALARGKCFNWDVCAEQIVSELKKATEDIRK